MYVANILHLRDLLNIQSLREIEEIIFFDTCILVLSIFVPAHCLEYFSSVDVQLVANDLILGLSVNIQLNLLLDAFLLILTCTLSQKYLQKSRHQLLAGILVVGDEQQSASKDRLILMLSCCSCQAKVLEGYLYTLSALQRPVC